MEKKRGVSPVIATVLLVVIVVIIALIVFMWFRGIVTEEATKFGENARLACADVSFSASYSNGLLQISNNGNVPIYGMDAKVFGYGSHETIDLSESSKWQENGLSQGEAFSDDMADEFAGANEVILIPVLLGSKSDAKVEVKCEEQYGYSLTI